MKQALFTFVLVLSLLTSNATGYHCHGSGCGDEMIVSFLNTDIHHDHDGNDHHKKDSDPSSDEAGKCGPACGHSHGAGAESVMTFSTSYVPSYISLHLADNYKAVIGADSGKPLLEPPSYS